MAGSKDSYFEVGNDFEGDPQEGLQKGEVVYVEPVGEGQLSRCVEAMDRKAIAQVGGHGLV